ncbi:hypothetical protein A2U01_0108112, partial [Trifolium medium]|nr:hypothetical protein [Trifolium medium]
MKLRDALPTKPSWTIIPTAWRDAPFSPARRAVDRNNSKHPQHQRRNAPSLPARRAVGRKP